MKDSPPFSPLTVELTQVLHHRLYGSFNSEQNIVDDLVDRLCEHVRTAPAGKLDRRLDAAIKHRSTELLYPKPSSVTL